MEVVNTIDPSILSIINSSIFYGTVPSGFKHTITEPVLKKMGKEKRKKTWIHRILKISGLFQNCLL